MKRAHLVLGALLIGIVITSIVLPLSLFQSGLIITGLLLVAFVALVPGVWPPLYRRTGVSPLGWLVGIAFATIGIGLSYLVGDPQPFCEGVVPYRGCLTPYGWAAAVYLGSSLGVAIAAGHLSRYRRLRNASHVPAADVSEGLVAVEGHIEQLGSTVDGPVSGKPAVWYRTIRESARIFGPARQLDSETGGDQFYVADGSGQLLVHPDGFDPHDVADLARSATDTEEGLRRREWRYEPDDTVTVVGEARSVSRAEYPAGVVVGVDEPAILGRRSLDGLRSWARQRAVIGGILGLGVGGIALLVMLLMA